MWVRLYDLHFKGRSNLTNIKALSEKICSFISMEEGERNDINKSVRVRLRIDVVKSLKDKVNIKLRGGDVKPVVIKYEKMPLVCFICRMMGHGDKDFPDHVGENSTIKRFCSWLKSSPWRGNSSKAEQSKVKREVSCSRRPFTPRLKSKEVPLGDVVINSELLQGKVG